MQEDCLSLFKTKEELEVAASDTSQLAQDPYKHSTYLYYLTRYLVSVYEGQFGEIPIQVWNEYRNALDHYFRHITADKEFDANLRRMEGHLQRAVLDVSKIICHDSQEGFKKKLSKEKDECLRLVEDGKFYRDIISSQHIAEQLFVYAKTTDSALGESARTDKEILGYYLKATFESINLMNMFIEKHAKIDQATREHQNICARAAHNAERHGFFGHVMASLTAKIIWGVLVFISGIFVTTYWNEITKYWHEFISLFTSAS